MIKAFEAYVQIGPLAQKSPASFNGKLTEWHKEVYCLCFCQHRLPYLHPCRHPCFSRIGLIPMRGK